MDIAGSGSGRHPGLVTEVGRAWYRSAPLRVAVRALGVVALVSGGVAAVLFVLGAWNPWRLVALEYRFGNPMVGLLVAPALVLVGSWLALPVRDETRPRGRIAVRWLAGGLALAGLFGWGVLGDHFDFTAEELGRSPDGAVAVALVRDGDTPPRTVARVWVGTGLGTREVGELGRVCGGSVSVEFLDQRRFMLRTTYGDWPIELDRATGEPLQELGPGCSDGPRPVR